MQPSDATFTHTVRDIHEQSAAADPFQLDATPPARISMLAREGMFLLFANSEGYLHLARVFAELGLRKLPDGHHFHFSSTFSSLENEEDGEFTFSIDNRTAEDVAAGDAR